MPEDVQKRQMPRGGRKGGAIFPRHSLNDCLPWAKKLVSKTYLTPQPEDVIFSGVVGAKSGKGQVKISALRQFGLLEGKPTGYSASALAKKIVTSPEEELGKLYQDAVTLPVIFRNIFNTFQGDEVGRAKLRQRAAELNVHPEQTEACVAIYVESLSAAGLVNADGERVRHVSLASLEPGQPTARAEEVEGNGFREAPEADENFTPLDGAEAPEGMQRPPRAIFNVNVTLDSSLDTEKLQKQLELLKRFGAI